MSVSDKTVKKYYQGKARNITMGKKGNVIIKDRKWKWNSPFIKSTIVYFKDFTFLSTCDNFFGINYQNMCTIYILQTIKYWLKK